MTFYSKPFRTRQTTICTLNMTRIDVPLVLRRMRLGGAAAALFCATLTGCSAAAPLPTGNDTADLAASNMVSGQARARDVSPADRDGPVPLAKGTLDASGNDLRPTGAPGPAPRGSDRYKVSQVLGKRDRTLQGGDQVCDINFVYAGRLSENVFWEEPCRTVTAMMMDRAQLERLNRWERLDEFQQKFVQQMPGGLVLYVGGEFSAAVYPYGTTGTVEEVAVAD